MASRSETARLLAERIIADLARVTGADEESQATRRIMVLMAAELFNGERTAKQARGLEKDLYGRTSRWKNEFDRHYPRRPHGPATQGD